MATPRTVHVQCNVPLPPDEVWAWHTRPGAFERLAPPWHDVRLERHDGILEGADAVLRMRRGPFSTRWVARHERVTPGEGFSDRQVRGPFAEWVHDHAFRPAPGGATVEETVRYRLGFPGVLAGGSIHRDVAAVEAFRMARLREDLSRHAAAPTPMRVAVTGASGLLGTGLSAFLRAGGHEVVPLSRGGDGPTWSTDAPHIDTGGPVDAVVHLAGHPISVRWTAANRCRILHSRLDATRHLATALAALPTPPKVLVCASGAGYYGNQHDPVDEAAPRGGGFLADVVAGWESAADPARDAGIRVAHARMGPVLHPRGGAMAKLLPPFRAGLGGRVGRGDQPFPWVAHDDAVYALHHLLTRDVAGPVNVVAPGIVTFRHFAKTLGRVLRRPAVVPLPAPAVRLLFGQMGQEVLLWGQHAVPRRLEADGYRFAWPELEPALRMMLGKAAPP